jgi:hypothetical protein
MDLESNNYPHFRPWKFSSIETVCAMQRRPFIAVVSIPKQNHVSKQWSFMTIP